jgi:hypothetical protein
VPAGPFQKELAVSRQTRDNSPFVILALALGMSMSLGCGGDKKPAAASPTAQAPAQPRGANAPPAADGESQPAADQDKKKLVEGSPPGNDERYALSIETPEAKAGERAQVVVRVVPKEPWHMNLDFPTSLKVDAPGGVELANADLKKADATALDEDQAQFDVQFTAAQAGDKAFVGTFKFAVCQDSECAPVTENVEFKVAVR